MVSIGTVITLGVIAAITAGGYAVYVNSSKIGSALSRGVDQTLVNPLGQWADNLFATIENTAATVDKNISDPDPTKSKTSKFFQSELDSTQQYTPTGKTQQEVLQEQPNLIPVGTTTTRSPDYRPSTAYKAGYYYYDYGVNAYDRQQYLSAVEAKKLLTADPSKLFAPGGLENIKYIGASKLGPAGLNLFARSQNYL